MRVILLFSAALHKKLCAAFVFSVPLGWICLTKHAPQRHKEHSGHTEFQIVYRFVLLTRRRESAYANRPFALLVPLARLITVVSPKALANL